MTTHYPWCFEPCSPEDECDPAGQPWAHAVRGRKPQRPSVIGYGHAPDEAEDHAIREAHQQDAREVLGERGEVVTQLKMVTRVVSGKYMMTVYDAETNTALVQGELAAMEFYAPPLPSRMSGLGSVYPSWNSSWQSIGT